MPDDSLHNVVPYSTADELAFLRKLGSYTMRLGRVYRADHQALLMRYREAMAYRTQWGHIDAEVIRTEVGKMLVETLVEGKP